MTITLPTSACRRDRAARLAHRRMPATEPVASRVPAPRESVENLGPAPTIPEHARSPRVGPHRRHIPRNAMRDDEMAAQALALAAESANLRERAARVVSILTEGGQDDLARIDARTDARVDAGIDAQIDAVLRAFRSYEPFLSDRDRALNDTARRRLSAAARR